MPKLPKPARDYLKKKTAYKHYKALQEAAKQLHDYINYARARKKGFKNSTE